MRIILITLAILALVGAGKLMVWADSYELSQVQQ